ncbi:glycerol-3-phosphate acyltransferase [Mycoplasmoides fastidiosum]|nr:glycerol-3-phosphate acyltransferase [Mycoplasmoides fastidiosum]UUD37865.1 glycerol-3-phosphate acyltransferase [Mycoplasmoides fastidiosum]
MIGLLIGSISFSKIVSYIKKIDLLNQGSKNAGATNLARLSKLRFGYLVAFADMGKVILAGYLFYLVAGYTSLAILDSGYITENNMQTDFRYVLTFLIYLTPAVATFAHCFPLYSGFRKGGKAVASFAGFTFFVSPWLGLFFVGIWWAVQLIKSYVSLSSIIAALLTPFFYWIPALQRFYWISRSRAIQPRFFFILGQNRSVDWVLITYVFLLLLAIALLLIWRHRENIVRLLTKQERKFSVIKKFIKK